jgi:hypothetical protein
MINLGYFTEELVRVNWACSSGRKFLRRNRLNLNSQTSSKKFLVNWLGLTGHEAKGGNFSGEID